MVRAAFAMIVLSVLLAPVHSEARSRYKVEITPQVGYSFGGDFSGGSYKAEQEFPFTDLDIDDGLCAGLTVDFPVSRSIQFEVLLNRQSTVLQLKELTAEDAPLLELGVSYWHLGVLFQSPRRSMFPFGTVHAGVTSFNPKENFDGMTRFSTAFGFGVKSFVDRSVGVRFQIRAVGTYITSSDEVFCDPGGFCYDYANSTWMWQGELTGGLIIGL